MEKEAAEQFQLLGALSNDIKEAFNTLLGSSRRKPLMRALAFALLLTLSFASLGQNFSFGPRLFNNYEKQIGRGVILPGETTLREMSSEWRELILMVVAPYIAFLFALSMLSMAAVLYTVASIYSANNEKIELCIHVPRIWKCLTLTFLGWLFLIPLGFFAAIIFFPADHKLRSGTFLFGVFLLIVVSFCFQMYITTVWYLASVVCVLKGKYYCLGSGYFFKLKPMTALALIILNVISGGLGALLGRLFGYAIEEGRRHGVGIAATAVYRTLLLGLLCFVALMVLLTQTLLYFVCKSYQHESIDENCSVKVYNVGDYEPLNTSTIQVEHLLAEV